MCEWQVKFKVQYSPFPDFLALGLYDFFSLILIVIFFYFFYFYLQSHIIRKLKAMGDTDTRESTLQDLFQSQCVSDSD